MLKFCSILNGCSLEPEPTFFVWSIFAPPHTSRANYSAIHIWLKKYIILWLLHKKPNWYIAYLTSWTKELTLQDQFTCRGQSFWMETSCHVVCSRKSKQLIHYDSIGFRNKTQTAERACPDFQTYRLSLHWSMFILTFSLCLQSVIRLNSQFPHIRWFKLDPTAHMLLSIMYKQLLPKRAGMLSALTPVLKWTSNTGLICQWNMFVQEYTALTGPTDSQTLSMTLWMTFTCTYSS